MTDGEYPNIEAVLAQLPPKVRDQARERAAQGDIPYPPVAVKFERDRAWFPGTGWIAVPGLDPATLPLDEIAVVYVVRRGDQFGMEVILRTAPQATEEQKALRLASALRTEAARKRFFRRASPAVAAEVRSRLQRGQLAFLPDQLQVEDGRVYLDIRGKKLPVDDIDPAAIGQVEVAFLVTGPAGNYLEVVWRTQ